MAGNLSEQATRAQKWLAGQKWKIRKAVDYRPRSDVQVVERLLEDVPREFLSGIVQYLQSAVSETNPQIEGKPYFGTWLFSRHIWERNESPGDNTVTFIQTMIAGAGVTAVFIVEKGMAYVLTQTFYWDVETLPAVTQSVAGTGYSLAAISRDRETGKYTCVLEQKVAVAQEEHGSFSCNNGSNPGTRYWWWWRNQAAQYGDTLMDGVAAYALKNMSCGLNDWGLEDGSATAFVSTVAQLTDSYVGDDQVTYQDSLEISENRRSTGSSSEDAGAADKGKCLEYARIRRVKITTNNDSTHSGAAAKVYDWTKAAAGKPHPIDSGVRNFNLVTGVTIFQAWKVELVGYSPWKAVPVEGMNATFFATLIVPPVTP
jgi:hypothetical protein